MRMFPLQAMATPIKDDVGTDVSPKLLIEGEAGLFGARLNRPRDFDVPKRELGHSLSGSKSSGFHANLKASGQRFSHAEDT